MKGRVVLAFGEPANGTMGESMIVSVGDDLEECVGECLRRSDCVELY